jgi:hypothetical protein
LNDGTSGSEVARFLDWFGDRAAAPHLIATIFGVLPAGALMIIGGIAAGVGIRNPRHPDAAPEDAEAAEKLDFAPHA